jgi:hypothetical protein
MSDMEICQSCGGPIQWGSEVIAVRYGRIHRAVTHTTVSKKRVDYFHASCSPAFAVKL